MDKANDTSNSSDTGNESLQQREEKWQKVVRRRRPVVVGNSASNTIKAVPKFVNIHVSRLEKSTTLDELEKLLRGQFPEVRCESIKSKYPELYTSFKVSVYEKNFKQIMCPDVWPCGAIISRFLNFRMRTKDVQIT